MPKGTVKWFNSQKGYGFMQPQGGSKLWALGVAELEIASNALDDIAYLRRARCRGWRVQRMDNELDAEAVVVWLREAPQPRHRQERN